MRGADKERVLSALVDRLQRRYASVPSLLEERLADAVYHERRRLRGEGGAEADFWQDVQRGLVRADHAAGLQWLRRISRRYADEICGTFDERVYAGVTRTAEPLLGMLLNATSPTRLLRGARRGLDESSLQVLLSSLPQLSDAIQVRGATDALLRLRAHGTILLVPTHVSHVDSVAMGWALWKMKLPPFLYGAGLNLFSNPMLGFFLRNLGAYTVDRRKTCPVYKEVLKEYASLTLENGYDNIFFPGGTRSRSGALERRLKLGLLSTALSAYQNNLRAGVSKRVFIVPATLSYQLVLEAETLVEDFLQDVGKARYIITDDEASKPKRVLEFMKQLLSLDSKIVLQVGNALDPFGNRVNEDGLSVDPNGRTIDSADFLRTQQAWAEDSQRDAEYTIELGQRVAEAYAPLLVVQCTHVVAQAALNVMRVNHRGDLLRWLRTGGSEDASLHDLYAETQRCLELLRAHAQRGKVLLADNVQQATPMDVVSTALQHFASYHTQAALHRRGDRIESHQRGLLFYYANRLAGFDLHPPHLAPALHHDHRVLHARA
jgi:glycerol-3-phosphate O-acyltransferase